MRVQQGLGLVPSSVPYENGSRLYAVRVLRNPESKEMAAFVRTYRYRWAACVPCCFSWFHF